MTSWLYDGPPACHWISCFYFPQGFLTSVNQNYSRRYGYAIDLLYFSFETTKSSNKDEFTVPSDEGVYI